MRKAILRVKEENSDEMKKEFVFFHEFGTWGEFPGALEPCAIVECKDGALMSVPLGALTLLSEEPEKRIPKID